MTKREDIPRTPFSTGVNLTGWLEHRPTDQIRADMFSRKDFADIRSLGCDVIRLPVHFERFCSPEDGYAVPQKILDILDRAAGWSEELGMYLILDFHNATDAGSVTVPGVREILCRVWTELAERYKDRFPYLIFEIMNEPHGIETEAWNRIILEVFRAIREIDRDRYIVAGGADWNSLAGMRALPDFGDDRVIYTFHFYDPHTFTHQGAPWCNMQRVTGIPFPYDPAQMPPLPENPTDRERFCFESYPARGTVEALRAEFEAFRAFREERKAPVFCGEYGCNAFSVGNSARVNWYRIVTDLMDEYDLPRLSWDYFGSFGLFTSKPYMERRRPEFPRDLNPDLLRAMGLTLPAGCPEFRTIAGLSHTALRTRSLPDTLRYYTEVLGLREAFRMYGEDGSLATVYLYLAPGQYLELFAGGAREGTTGRDVTGFCHICLMTADIRRAYEAVKAAGGPLDSEIKTGKSRCLMFWTHDPDGIQIEVMEMPPESLQAQADRRIAREESGAGPA